MIFLNFLPILRLVFPIKFIPIKKKYKLKDAIICNFKTILSFSELEALYLIHKSFNKNVTTFVLITRH